MTSLARQTLAILRQHRRGLLIFYLMFAGLAFSVFTPAFSWALAALQPVTGRAAISAGDLVHFLTSPGGVLWLVVTAALAFLLIVLQQAGMVLISTSHSHGEYGKVLSAVWGVARRFRSLLSLTVVQVAAHGLLAMPFILVVAVAYQLLLSPYDAYYLRLERPAVLGWFAGIAGVALIGMAFANGWLFLRWLLTVPLVVLDNRSSRAALNESVRLTRNQRLPAIVALLAGAAALIILPAFVTLLFRVVGGYLLQVLPAQTDILMPTMLVGIGLYTLFTLTIAFLGIAAYSTLVYAIYRRATGLHHTPMALKPGPRTGPLTWSAEALLIALALSQSWLVVQSFDFRDNVTVTAHRGSSLEAPENTRSAIELAIDDGADYVEIDVRMTADGVPVLWHDADMRQVFGRAGPISDLTYREARELDAGSWFGPEFEGERILSLEEAIDLTRDRVQLYVDLKPSPDTPNLTRTVVELLQRKEALDGTVIAAADTVVLNEVRRLEPSLKTALLAQFIIGPLRRGDFDILGLRQNRVTPAAVAQAHHTGDELHVWTVNRPDAMARFIDMGVDNIITDRPAMLADLLRRRSEMTDAELLTIKMRNWMR